MPDILLKLPIDDDGRPDYQFACKKVLFAFSGSAGYNTLKSRTTTPFNGQFVPRSLRTRGLLLARKQKHRAFAARRVPAIVTAGNSVVESLSYKQKKSTFYCSVLKRRAFLAFFAATSAVTPARSCTRLFPWCVRTGISAPPPTAMFWCPAQETRTSRLRIHQSALKRHRRRSGFRPCE